LGYGAIHFKLVIFQNFYIFIDFLFYILHGLFNFIELFEFSLNFLSCLFIPSLRSDTSFHVSSLNSLIILTIIVWNSVFDISSSSLLFRSLEVELAFEGEMLLCCFMFLC
jgi:hypothetical protein